MRKTCNISDLSHEMRVDDRADNVHDYGAKRYLSSAKIVSRLDGFGKIGQ